MAANRSYIVLKIQLKSQLLSRKTKILIYRILVRPILTYTAETWIMTKNYVRRLSTLKGKSFAEYIAQYARKGSGRRDTIEN